MFLLWILISVASGSSLRISCTDTAADICQDGQPCSVSCDEDCPLFFESDYDAVSLCGWLQSLGYDTANMVATSLNYNLNIRSVSSPRAKRSMGQVSSHVHAYKNFRFIRQPESQMKREGSRILFYCDAEGNSSLRYQWYKSLVPTFTSAPYLPSIIEGAEGQEFVIDYTRSTDNGYYICVVTEEGASGDVYWSQPAKLEVMYLEEPTVQINNLGLISGDYLQKIPCNLPNSYPPAVATWYKKQDDGTLDEIFGIDDKFYDPEKGILYLINIQRGSHDGEYHCYANNTILNQRYLVRTVTVTVSGSNQPNQRPPQKAFFDQQAALTATIGSQVVLRCAAYGNPIPTVYWSFGDDIDTLCKIPSSRYTSYDEGRMIVINQVKQQDAEYRYVCQAQSGSNPIIKIGSLTDVGVYRDLEITVEETRFIPHYGHNISIRCPVTGESANYWYKNGDRLSISGDNYDMNRTSNALEIRSSTRTHGVYTCLSMSRHGGLVLENLHMTIPVLELTVHLARDISDVTISNDVETPAKRNDTLVTCTASGFPPPRLYWYQNNKLVTDSSRYSFSFNKSNFTVINTTLNISKADREPGKSLNIECVAVSQTEGYVREKSTLFILESEGDTDQLLEDKDNTTMYIIIGGSAFVTLLLIALTIILGIKFKKERRNTKPIRTYIKDIQKIQIDGGGDVSTKADLREEYKYAAHLHDILKTMKINDKGDIESFRDIIGDWMNEDINGNEESDFARRFRDSFISKRSMGNRLNSSNRYGNQFKLDLKERKASSAEENNLLDETPEKNYVIPLGGAARGRGVRPSPRRPSSSNPIYRTLPESISDDPGEETVVDSLRHTEI